MSLGSQGETDFGTPPVATRPPADAHTVLMSMNPRAGSRHRLDRIRSIESALGKAGYDVRTTGELEELAELAKQLGGEGGLRAVLAAGGDGTASVVRNHVPLSVPLLPVPMGTENLLGRYAGQTSDATAVLRTVEEGVTVGLDLGRANGKYFLLMISAGFDAEVIRALHENRRGNIRRTSYVAPVLRAMWRFQYPQMEFTGHGSAGPSAEPAHCRWLFGFNLPLYALGLPIAPDAVATDGLLDVCAFQHGTTWSIVRYLWHVVRSRHFGLSDTSLLRAQRFRLEATNSPDTAYQLDGDHGGVLPVEVDVLPGELRLLVPPATAARLGFALPEDCQVSC